MAGLSDILAKLSIINKTTEVPTVDSTPGIYFVSSDTEKALCVVSGNKVHVIFQKTALNLVFDSKVNKEEGKVLINSIKESNIPDNTNAALSAKANFADLQNVVGGLRNNGEVADLTALNAITGMVDGDAYKVLSVKDSKGNSYIYRYTVTKNTSGTVISAAWVNTKLVALDGDIAYAGGSTKTLSYVDNKTKDWSSEDVGLTYPATRIYNGVIWRVISGQTTAATNIPAYNSSIWENIGYGRINVEGGITGYDLFSLEIEGIKNGIASIKFNKTSGSVIRKDSTIGGDATITLVANWYLSDYISVDVNKTYQRNGYAVPSTSSTAEIHFFDANNKYLGYLNKALNTYNINPSDFPTNTVKVRLQSTVDYSGEFSFKVISEIKSDAVEGLDNIASLNSLINTNDHFLSATSGYIDSSGNKIITSSTSVWKVTDYIKVTAGLKVTYNGTTIGSTPALYGYDADLTPKTALLLQGTFTNSVVTIPEGVEYVIGTANSNYTYSLIVPSFNQSVIDINEIALDLIPDIFIPSKVYSKMGESISFNLNGIVNKHPKDYSKDIFFNTPLGNEDFLKVTPTSDFSVPIKARLLNNNLITLGTLNVKVKTTTPVNPVTPQYFIHFGDSTVEGSYNSGIQGAVVNELSRRLNGVGTSLTPTTAPAALNMSNMIFIGTLGNQSIKHEGRGGWSFNKYLTTSTDNAFWNSTSQSFDLSYYLSQNGFSGVSSTGDNLTILCQMGWNDIFTRTLAQIEADVISWLTSVRNSKSAIRMKLISMNLPPYDVFKAYTGTRDQSYVSTMRKVFSIARLYEKIASENDYSSWVEHISYMPTFFTEDAYPAIELQISSRNSATKKVYTDDVHPVALGYAQMADTLFYNLIYNYC